ncbi:uncharacterized protein LOC119831415 [Zerene cesonia]|uniref:uncharacterized protein LOC119831415 n=1 Tax=Zerene cesonia TaxID=33412 RepID=UPI0018E53FF7|nr:uncharacterized protein LOC119831415 [Zerene cesonia]XP_038210674.1 uncharacterized protein LOC119831415 [Zerene cesonia]
MSTSSEYEPVARQSYGPTTSSENIFEHILESKVMNTMDAPSVRTPVLRAVPISSNEGDPEPDSTNHESIIKSVHKLENKDIDYHINDKVCDGEMSVDSLPRIMRIEEASLDTVGHIAYPILQETDDSSDGNYIENTATLIQAPLSSAIVQNVAKLPQNFTINVDAAVGNITAIQNVSQDVTGNQTLWLPTILATSAPTDNKNDDDRQQGVSQFIITSESYVNDANLGRRANIIETNYNSRPKTSKVQILSNITLPKNANYSQQYITQNKDMTTQVYGTQNHVYKLSANVVSQKHINNSVLCTKTGKSQSLIGGATLSPTVINNSPVKNVSYGFTKGTNINKVNNGANLNTMVAASSGNMQCHILSRVVSAPNKVSVHSGKKSVNTFKGKNSQVQKNQSRAIKIIQQAGTAHKSESKTWPVASVTYKGQSSNYNNMDSNTSKVIQKVGSPSTKNHQPLALQKVQKAERLVLQSPCGPVLLTTAPISTSLPKGPHYVQSGATPNLRYVQTYGPDNQLSTISQVSANQQLTAQILQSLSQPKLMLQQSPTPVTPKRNNKSPHPIEEITEVKPTNRKRIVFGDKSTLLTADDIIGTEERPNLSEELRRYTHHALAFIMLDHTYALPMQKQPTVSSPTLAPISTPPSSVSTTITTTSAPATITTVTQVSSPLSPLKISPVIPTTTPFDLTLSTIIPTSVPAPLPVATVPVSCITYKPQPPPQQDDDAASVISSIEGERRPPEQGGSDTETAPEGEEEGKTRCICDFTHDDGYMICCDRCGEWQHVDCMGIDRNNIPDAYMCELCQPRAIDRRHARAIQLRKREELSALGASDSDSSECTRIPGQRRKRLLTVTTYTNTSGSCVTTYNSNIPVLPPLPQPSLPPLPPKRGPKRPKKAEIVRKGTKRKLTEKRVKRKKELMLNRNKYNASMSNNQSHWRDLYEVAMTNHYSPELRAKIMKYSSKLGNTSNMASSITAHLCTTVPHAGGKILIATKDLKENTPIIELRGKYMLSNQHRPQLQNSARAGSQKPGPFVFFYRLPKDNTQICIDTRTYGNEARFVRRSCKPNAELQHCIVKGALHVYLVTIGVIQSNTEITVGHDTDGSKQPCACGNPKHCKVNGVTSMSSRKPIDFPSREKRSRNRCYSSSSPLSPPLSSLLTTPTKEIPPPLKPEAPIIKPEKKSPIKHELPPMSPVKEPIMSPEYFEPIKSDIPEIKEEHQEIDLTAKEEMKPDLDEPDFVKIEPKIEEKPEEIPMPEINYEPEPVHLQAVVEEKEEKPTIELFETTKEPVLPSLFTKIEVEEPKVEKVEEKNKTEPKSEDEKPVTREVTAKSACHDRSSRSSRTTCVNQDSLDDKTDDSQDKLPTPSGKEKDKRKMTREERKMEAIMKAFERMERAEQRKQEVKERQKRRESDPHPHNYNEKDDDDDAHNSFKKRKRRKGRARTASQSNRRRLNSADSDLVTSGDEAQPFSPPPEHSRNDVHSSIDEDKSHEPVSENLGLSSACLLVEAAVGSVESAFKQPKTKKTMANEWIGRSPDRTPSPYNSPYRPPLVSATSLESLVRVASTMIGDLSGGQDYHEEEPHSPPRTPGRDRNKPPKKAKRITRSTPPAEVTEVAQPMQHSAKKRWLRQAISEESDTPCIDTFVSESPPNEMVTPLKKRRLARESLSCDQNPIDHCHDETSPVLTSEDSPVKEDSLALARQYKRNIMDMYARDRTRSDSGQGSDDQCNIDHDVLNVNLKGPHNSEHIRRIIGVPDDETLEIPKPVDIPANNNNNLEIEETNNKVVPMEIDTTVITQSKIESNEINIETKGIESPNEKIHSSQSADTSGNSSPQRDEMDDIQKKIHSFHTENIMILKSRNKKPPKEKRKKVNLNFDLNMVDDQISIQLRTEDDTSNRSESNGDIHDDANLHEDAKMLVSPENIPLPPVESIPLPAPETIPLPEETNPMPIIPPPETIPLPEEPMKPHPAQTCPESPPEHEDKEIAERPTVLESTVPFSTRFSSTGLFSGIFSNMTHSFKVDSPINENIPNMSLIKSAIDRTTSLDNSIFDKDSITPVDELKSVQEILTRVNNMDSNNSVLLSGVLKSSNKSSLLASPAPASSPRPSKPYCPRNDPRLNPPPADKPKPVRRKLSITEYRKRHKGPAASDDAGPPEGGELCAGPEWSSGSTTSSGSASLSPQRLDAAAAAAVDDLEQRLHKDLSSHMPKGVFDAQPTASERQRENLSSRLRREFGLALPDDEEARPPTDTSDGAEGAKRCER